MAKKLTDSMKLLVRCCFELASGLAEPASNRAFNHSKRQHMLDSKHNECHQWQV